MAKSSEEISNYNANSGGKTDSNLANDALHLGGIPADEFATQKYVQNYHETKEALQKEYIDEQDSKNLQEVKAYADQIVNNQDFSSFAKTTDVQALDTKLTEEIQAQATSQKDYTDSQIAGVVEDVNSNFDDVGSAITQLNNTTAELFTSVSNGKSKIAAAITDKGVETASDASYETMATNISNISSGSLDIDSNFVNTSDATATAEDILLGKTAYAQGNKIYGTYVETDSSTGYPTYGTDTTGATATAADIAFGKTAWANGVLLTGTAIFEQSTEVEEIYGASSGAFEIADNVNAGMTTYPDTEDEVTKRYCFAFSKDTNYCVSCVQLNGTSSSKDFSIESHLLTNTGLVIQASNGSDGIIYKKYRYTKDELGIGENEYMSQISLGCAGLLGDSSKCLLMISTYDSLTDSSNTQYYLHFYTYHLSENGVIGKAYDNEKYIIDNYIVNYTNEQSTARQFYFTDTDPLIMFSLASPSEPLYYKKVTLSAVADTTDTSKVNILINFGNTQTTANGDVGGVNILPYGNTNIITTSWLQYTYSDTAVAIYLTDEFNVDWYISLSGRYQLLPLSDLKLIALYKSSSYGIGFRILNSDGTSEKTVYGKSDEDNDKYPIFATITPDRSKIIAICGQADNIGYIIAGTLTVVVFNVEDILNADDSSVINPIQTQLSTHTTTSYFSVQRIQCAMNANGTRVVFCGSSSLMTPYLCILSLDDDQENLVGVKYKNQTFYTAKTKMLTATSDDVIAGKTFVGYNAEVETGTLEV